MDAKTNPPRPTRATFLLAVFAACLAGGCAGRFSARTDYLAPGFNRESFRGKTVAVVPAGPADAAAYEQELAGVIEGMHEAGARAQVVREPLPPAGAMSTQPNQPAQWVDDTPPTATTRPRLLGMAVTPSRLGHETGAAYALVVRFTEAVVYRAYATPEDRGGPGFAAPAERTTGRRVGFRLELVRLADGEPQWVAHGTGDVWSSRTAAAPGAAPAAANVDDDLGGGNLNLYPAPPSALVLSRRLVRRLLAHVPFPIEVQPN
jgi:hypothetical protein